MSDRSIEPQALYDRGLDHLDRYLHDLVDEALPEAVAAFRSAASLDPGNVRYWAALGFALDSAGESEEARTALRLAHRLDPNDDVIEVFVLTLLSETGPEGEASASVDDTAARMGIELEPLRRELAEAGFPVDSSSLLGNGFLHARNFLRSRVEDEIDESQRRRSRLTSPAPGSEAELKECAELQREIEFEFELSQVPHDLRSVAPWAMRLGVGDDVCRSRLMNALFEVERAELLAVIKEHAAAVHAWLDGFRGDPMPIEAAACMYLLLAVEESEEGL